MSTSLKSRRAGQLPSFRELLGRRNSNGAVRAAVYEHDPVPWMEAHYRTQEPGGLITLEPVQVALLRFMFQPPSDPADERTFRFNDLHYSTIKKSGKTAVGGAIGQWAAQDDRTWGRFGEVYSCANDLEQAHSRIFRAIAASIAQDPEVVAGTGDWRPGWPDIVTARAIRNVHTGTSVSPVSGNYAGAAGGNPTLTLFSELWGYRLEASRRLWSEMKPSPVRARSVRFVETYRGFRGESMLLEEREVTLIERGRQVTVRELLDACGLEASPFEEAPGLDDHVPIYVNERAGMCGYIDEGDQARRMPWQRGPAGDLYYQQQKESELPGEYDRHHRNLWAQPQQQAIPIEWWDACLDAQPVGQDAETPLVVAIDAGVSHDAFAFQAVSRHPTDVGHIIQRADRMWLPPPGGALHFGDPADPAPDSPRGWLRHFCAQHNVVQIAYDPHELHEFVTTEKDRGYGWFRPFQQGDARLKADKGLYDLVRDRRLHHLGTQETREHVQNCAAKVPKDDDSRMRLVKSSSERLIDLAVALSMACAECQRLNL